MSKEYKSGYVDWWNRGNLAHTPSKSNKLERQLEEQDKLKGYYFNPITNSLEPRSDPSPHISSEEKYEHEQATFNPTLGKFVGQKTDRIFPDMSSAVTQNKRYDEVEFANRIVEGKEPKKPIHKQLEDLKFYHQGNTEQLNRVKKAEGTAPVKKKTWGSQKEFENYITKKPLPKEYAGTWGKFVKQQKVKRHNNIPNRSLDKTTPVKINYSMANELSNLETLRQMEINSDKKAAAFRKAMEPAIEDDTYKGIGTFAPLKKKTF